jgi:hypothetical protein
VFIYQAAGLYNRYEAKLIRSNTATVQLESSHTEVETIPINSTPADGYTSQRDAHFHFTRIPSLSASNEGARDLDWSHAMLRHLNFIDEDSFDKVLCSTYPTLHII